MWGSQLRRVVLESDSSKNNLGSETGGVINESDSDNNGGGDNASDIEPVWAQSTHLVYEKDKHYINLKPQTPLMRSVIEEAFEEAF